MKLLVPPQSGSISGQTASRNRFGQYMRSRAIPVNPTSTAQGLVRARLSANSAAWRLLTPAQRAGWKDLGLSMVRTDSLGQSYTLQGNQAHASVNNCRLLTGLAVVADAPAVATPVSLVTVTITCTAAAFSIAYTATPLAEAPVGPSRETSASSSSAPPPKRVPSYSPQLIRPSLESPCSATRFFSAWSR
jgi:hypothetical protein